MKTVAPDAAVPGHMKRNVLLTAVAAASATFVVLGSAWVEGGSSSGGSADAATFMSRVVRLVAANRCGKAWQHLHPVQQQQLVLRARYVECEGRTFIPGRVDSLAVLSNRETRLGVPGDRGAVTARAIRIRVAIVGALGQRVVVTHTYHAVALDRRWTWFLPTNRLSTYRRGECPGYAPTPPDAAGHLSA